MWKHQNYLQLDFVSDAIQAGDLIGHLNWHVQGELSEGKHVLLDKWWMINWLTTIDHYLWIN